MKKRKNETKRKEKKKTSLFLFDPVKILIIKINEDCYKPIILFSTINQLDIPEYSSFHFPDISIDVDGEARCKTLWRTELFIRACRHVNAYSYARSRAH